eukprot:CAMPEP_0196652494 /NCGR_PEP_ID=MMETSP1086-20130531/1819_1 /TAXON_ID=77921 /ORGANISM="Cyanoptyche  gloeocystis , Strain SAG4.97" /LENGTH=194 /DNA_ID=CAMNT_0041983083 /DNA_START=50 /DNA_END=634 /DNA_ORIENTATION=-
MTEATGSIPAANIIEFLEVCGKLKNIKRTGWVRHNVQLPESVSDHMYRMAMMSFLIDPSLDRDRAMKIAVVHDLAESTVGDITPFCGVSKEDKYNREKEAMKKIKEIFGDSPVGDELQSLWHEYEEGNSKEVQYVRDFDKFEMIVQAYEYEKAQGVDLQQFFDSTKDVFTTPTVRAWAEELRAKRAKLKQSVAT